MWHVSSRSGVATLRTAIHLLLTYLGLLTTVCVLQCFLWFPDYEHSAYSESTSVHGAGVSGALPVPPMSIGRRSIARPLCTRGVGTILTLRGRTFYESRPMHVDVAYGVDADVIGLLAVSLGGLD